jgi:steroid delta-isomerase-like uncharacterized protein
MVEAPKEEPKPKMTLGQLEEKTGRGMVEAANAHDAKKLASYYTETAVLKIAGLPREVTGRDAIAQAYQKFFEAFPDFKTGPIRIWGKGDVVVNEWAFNGTHSGDLMGVKATEKKTGLQGVDVLSFTPEGQVKEHHMYYDGLTVASQIGLSPQKARPIPTIPSSPQVFMTPATDEAKNVDATKAMAAALESKKEADFLAAMSDTAEYDDMTQPQTSKGKADAKKFFKEMTTGFPDAKTTTVNTLSVGDYVITENQWTGTHKGSFFGMAPTKKTVTMASLNIYQFKDGKMVKGWGYSNNASFMIQLGKLAPPGAGKPGAAKPADAKAAPTGDKKPADAAGDKKPADKK